MARKQNAALTPRTPPPRPPAKPRTPSGPREAEAAPPALSLHQVGAIAILRIHDLGYSPIVSVIAQALPATITQLMLVTPTDTKMFNLVEVLRGTQERTQQPQRTNGAVLPVAAGAGDETGEAELDFESDPQAEAIRLAQEGDEAAAQVDVEAAQAEANSAETPAQRREALKQLRKAGGEAGTNATCGRCRGSGQVMIAMPDGGASTAACPVCVGRGTIRRYGTGRR